MLKKLTSSIASISLLTQAAHCYSNTFDPAEFARATADETPLSIRVGPQALSPDVLEKLSTSSNIIFADLPNSPQFVSLKDYESIKFATNELLDELMQQDKSVVDPSREEQTEAYSNTEHNVAQAEEPLRQLEEFHQKHSKEQEVPETEEATATSWETSCSTSEEYTSSTWSSTTSSTTNTPESTSSEIEHSSSSFSKTTKKHFETSTSFPHSITKSISSKHYERTLNSSNVYPTSTGKHPGNYSNHTNGTMIGFDNSSNSIVPTSMLFAFLFALLLFTPSC